MEKKNSYRWQTTISVLVLFVVRALINISFSGDVKRLSLEAGKSNFRLSDSILDDVTIIGIGSPILGAEYVIPYL